MRSWRRFSTTSIPTHEFHVPSADERGSPRITTDRGQVTKVSTASPFWQLVRYGVVGLGSNALLYFGYLLLTSQGMGAKTAMTLLYALGVLQSFYFNRSWTFGHDGGVSVSFVKYVSCYAFGYVFNWTMLFLLVDLAGWPHQIVQAGLVLVTAGLLFVLQRYWVFADRKASEEPV